MEQLAARTYEVSKVLFNAQHRLAVSNVFLEDNEALLSYEEVASRASISRSVAHKELRVLVRIGAVGRIEAGRSVLYQRLASAYWPFVTEVLARPAR